MKPKEKKVIGYLPDERPKPLPLILYALQQIIVMFPATVLVATITGFEVSTTIFASGLATLCFILVTGKKIPLYYGSSFSYIAAIGSIMSSGALQHLDKADRIPYAQFGIVLSGLVSIVAGLIIKNFGQKAIDKVLPATVTGSIAIVIGLSLCGNAISGVINLSSVKIDESQVSQATNMAWVIGLVTLLSTIIFSVYLKGRLAQLPILFGLLTGYVTALIIGYIIDVPYVSFTTIANTAKDSASAFEKVFSIPKFSLPKPNLAAVVAIMPIAIATIPESTAHIYQLDIYVNDLAKKKGSKRYKIADKLGLNLIGDGIGDIISGMVGGPAGTNYGENISAMAVTKNFSVYILIAASIITMLISFFTPLINAVYSIPQAVISGLSIYLFGIIGAQGIAIMAEKKVNLFSARNLAVIAVTLVIGIGGSYAFPDGMIPFFGLELPAIATAAIFGIVLNLLLSFGNKDDLADVQEEEPDTAISDDDDDFDFEPEKDSDINFQPRFKSRTKKRKVYDDFDGEMDDDDFDGE